MQLNYARALNEDDGATLDELREAVTALEETAPIARRVLPDAIAIAQGGRVKRVAVVHGFGGLFVRKLLASLLALSPVKPARLFRDQYEEGVAWAAAWC